jgi:hypothetical protein
MHIDERTVPRNIAPRVLSKGIKAGMQEASKTQERDSATTRVQVDSNKRGDKTGDWSGRLLVPNLQRS